MKKIKTKKIGAYEVSTDGRIVWVNGILGCMARFGPNGFEVNSGQWVVGSKGTGRARGPGERNGEPVLETKFFTTIGDWQHWAKLVEDAFKIQLDTSWQPALPGEKSDLPAT
jgi:hypothetical protein